MSRSSLVGMLIAVEVRSSAWRSIPCTAGGPWRPACATSISPRSRSRRWTAGARAASRRRRSSTRASSVGVSTDGLVHVKDLTEHARRRVLRVAHGSAAPREAHAGRRLAFERPGTGHLHLSNLRFQPSGRRSRRTERLATRDRALLRRRGSRHHRRRDRCTRRTGASRSPIYRAPLTRRSDDGSINATHVRGDRLGMTSTDGRIVLKTWRLGRCTRRRATAASKRRVLERDRRAHTRLHTDDGSIHVALAPERESHDRRLHAATANHRRWQLPTTPNDAAQRTIRLGAATGSMKVSTCRRIDSASYERRIHTVMDYDNLIPLVAIVFIFGAPIAAFIVSRVLAHQERMEMLRRGFVPPPIRARCATGDEVRPKAGWTPRTVPPPDGRRPVPTIRLLRAAPTATRHSGRVHRLRAADRPLVHRLPRRHATSTDRGCWAA